jgi:hypothetical protein
MELLLNLVWLAVALGAFARVAAWARRQPDTAAGRRRVAAVVLATGCAVALLFPIISITDDLQTSAAVVEESIAVRRVAMATVLHIVPAILVACCLAASILGLTLLGFASSEPSLILPSSPAARVVSLRGPPRFVRR